MANRSLTPAATTATKPLSARTPKSSICSSKNGCCSFQTPVSPKAWWVGHQCQHHGSAIATSLQDHQDPHFHDHHSLPRRSLTMGLSGTVIVTVLGLSLGGDDEQSASAARRPPPPPPREKKDPNVSGVQAKVLASKRRKEAMKEEVAKLRGNYSGQSVGNY